MCKSICKAQSINHIYAKHLQTIKPSALVSGISGDRRTGELLSRYSPLSASQGRTHKPGTFRVPVVREPHPQPEARDHARRFAFPPPDTILPVLRNTEDKAAGISPPQGDSRRGAESGVWAAAGVTPPGARRFTEDGMRWP